MTVKDGKNKGSTHFKDVSGYCRTFEQLFEDFIDKEIGGSEAETLKELHEDILTLKKEITEMAKVLDESKFK
jgi:hypothetical protein